MKTLKQVLQGGRYAQPKSAGDQNFVNLHRTEVSDPLDHDDNLFTGSNVKQYDRSNGYGYNPGDDLEAYDEHLADGMEAAARAMTSGEHCSCPHDPNTPEGKMWHRGYMHMSGRLSNVTESAPPGAKAEHWIKSNKQRFIKQYGEKEGLSRLYGKAWNMFGHKGE